MMAMMMDEMEGGKKVASYARRLTITDSPIGFHDIPPAKQNGRGRIRTHGPRKGPSVFKTDAFGHSATLPLAITYTKMKIFLSTAFLKKQIRSLKISQYH